jgi:uncharacterized repeat protein (TIGR01451 family)
LALAILAASVVTVQHFVVTAQGRAQDADSAVRFMKVAEERGSEEGVAWHGPADSLILPSADRADLLRSDGTRNVYSRAGFDERGRLAAARETRNGFTTGEAFGGGESPGSIVRLAPDGSRTGHPWVVLPGEIGLVRHLAFDSSTGFGGDLIAVTTRGGVWRIDAAGDARRVTQTITADSRGGVESPVAFDSVMVAPNNAARYGPWAGKILAVAAGQGRVYAIGPEGAVESFDLGLARVNNILVIPAKENFFGIAIDRQSNDPSSDRASGLKTVWGASAMDFAPFEGDLLVAQSAGEGCECQPSLWRVQWDGSGFQKTRIAVLAGASRTTEWGQAAFSTFGAQLLQQQNQATPVVGPFQMAAAMGPTSNNDDFTLQEVTVAATGGVTTATATVRFINTLRNVGNAAGNFIISAPTIPAGFTVMVSSDSGATFTSLNGGGTARTPTPVNPNEERNLDVRITTPTGIAVNANYDVVIQVTSDTIATSFNRTIDRLRIVPPQLPQPMLSLMKSVRDVNGGLTVGGDILEYTLVLSNPSPNPVIKSFMTEFIPANVAYVANSVRVTAGANMGAKTDAIDNDQVDFFPPVAGSHNGQLNIATGAGAGGHGPTGLLIGGTMAPNDSTTVTFQVRVNTGLDSGTLVTNITFWGGNDIERAGQSNPVTTMISAPTPLVGPFEQPAATGPTGNNDDFTVRKVALPITNGLTSIPGIVRFINTLRNTGAAPGRFVVSAPVIPQGFSVRISVDSGATFTSLNGGAKTTTPTEVVVGESRNLDVRVELPAGLAINTDYDVVLQVEREDAPMKFNRTIDRVRPDPNPPDLELVKGVRDLTGRDINFGRVMPGQIVEYTLTLRNRGATAVGNTFIAEYLPQNISYITNSVRIATGPNSGPKTDTRGDDQVDYFPTGFTNGQINIFTGAGAASDRGGLLAGGESTMVVFRVMVNGSATQGTVIRNGADWGAEDFGIGGKSNIVEFTVDPNIASPLVGPFGQPAAVGPTDNNDDFTRSRVNLAIMNGMTTIPGTVRFINTVRNSGTVAGRFVVTAPTIPQGFSVRVSVDSGASFVSLNNNGMATLPSDMTPGEERNLDVRIDLPAGLSVTTDYDTVLQVTWDMDPTKSNRTIDRVRPDSNAPMLTLVKAVRDATGRDIAGGTVCPGQTIEYTLTLSNAGTTPVGNTFIAEYLPPNVTYVANSTQITAGANAGPKTDARGDDQVDFFPSGFVNGQINIFTGAGATALRGGALAPNESTTVAFRVTVNSGVAAGTVIRNGADWGAEDFGIGGKSNIVEVTTGTAQAPVVSTQPANQAACIGRPVTFSVTATGSGLSYQWRRNGNNISGATAASFTIASVAASDAGSYDVVVSNACAMVTSNAATLTINADTAIATQPANQTVCPGQPAAFTVAATGAGLTYQWRRNGANIAGATSATFTIASAAAADAGSYDVVLTGACNAVTSAAATLALNAATAIATQPVNQTVCLGQPAMFAVSATGTGLSYQWRRNGANIAGAASASFSIASVAAGDAGTYDVVVTGLCGTVTSSAATLALNPATAVSTQPANVTVCPGQPAMFAVAATGAGLTYQWRRNGVNIAGATAASFSIPSVAAGDAGSYDVVVTGLCGAVTSNAAVLTVNPATAITVQPVSQNRIVGQSVTFSVTATGLNLSYQWRRNGVNIPGATSASFTIASVAETDVGSYDVVVTGACGAVTSSVATLTTTPPSCLTMCFRSAAYFSLNFGTNVIPRGTVVINGVNLGNPVSSTDPQVKMALDGRFGDLNREYVAAQLNVLGASGLGAADVVTALASSLRCYGLNFSQVMVANGAVTFTPESRLFDLLNHVNSTVKGNPGARDRCVLVKLLNALNGNNSANVCHRSSGVIDFGSCN